MDKPMVDIVREIANAVFEEYFKAMKKFGGGSQRSGEREQDEIEEDIEGLGIGELVIESKIDHIKGEKIEINANAIKKIKKEQ